MQKNPQTENGYTKIANELLEALCSIRISGEAMQCYLFILRKTYGYNKKSENISLAAFESATGMPRPTCVRAIKKLVNMNLITINKDNFVTEYSINKSYDDWIMLSKKITAKSNTTVHINDENSLSKKITVIDNYENKTVDKKDTNQLSKMITPKNGTAIIKNDNSSLSKKITLIDNNDNKTVDNNDTHKRKKETFKETIKEREISFAKSLKPYLKNYEKNLLKSFFLYWTQINQNGRKMKFEKQDTFDISKRLATWKINENKWRNNNGSATKYNTTPDGLAKIAIKYFGDEIN